MCFLFGALLPVIPWFVTEGSSAAWGSLAIGVVTAGAVGGLVARFAERRLITGIVRQVLIVLVACGITYAIGEAVGVNLGG